MQLRTNLQLSEVHATARRIPKQEDGLASSCCQARKTKQLTPEQAHTCSKGKAIYAAGVQFAPVYFNGQTLLPGHNNFYIYIFPVIGMAVIATDASRVIDEMFIEAARVAADQVPSDLLLYPLQSNTLETEIQTAARLEQFAFDSGLARVKQPSDIVALHSLACLQGRGICKHGRLTIDREEDRALN